MNKTKKINKLGLVLTLVLVIALALVISTNATPLALFNADTDNISEQFSTGSFYYISYGDVPNGNFTIVSNLTDANNYCVVILEIEKFQNRYNGYTFQQFEQELTDIFYGGNDSVIQLFYTFLYEYDLVGFPTAESLFLYAMNYSVVSADVYNELQADYNTLQGEFNTLHGDYTRLGVMLDNAVLQYEQLQGDYNTLQGEYNTLQGEYNTLQGEYNTLEDSIPSIKANAKNEGYNEGMADADAVERGVMSIVGAPMYIITSVFDVEIFGINLLNLITTIMTVIIVAWVIKKLAN